MPTPPTPAPTDLTSILLAAKQRLIDASVFGTNAVYLGLSPEIQIPFPMPAQQFAVLVPSTQSADQPVVTGGGNAALFLDGLLDCYLYSRLQTDEIPRSDNWLTDQTLGALTTLRQIVNAFQLWSPVDTNNHMLVYTPFKLQTIEQGRRIMASPKMPEAPGWGSMVSRWKFKWWWSFTA